MKPNHQQNRIAHKVPLEDPVYHNVAPEKPILENSVGGWNKYGDTVHGSYRQPWVEHDGVVDPTGDQKIG